VSLSEVKNVPKRGILEENEDFSLARWANLGQPLKVHNSEPHVRLTLDGDFEF
jgi:hypothetical protein